MHKLSLVSFYIWTLDVLVIISQADPYDKTGDDIKGVANLTRNQLFSRVSLLHHHYSITIILIENVWEGGITVVQGR